MSKSAKNVLFSHFLSPRKSFISASVSQYAEDRKHLPFSHFPFCKQGHYIARWQPTHPHLLTTYQSKQPTLQQSHTVTNRLTVKEKKNKQTPTSLFHFPKGLEESSSLLASKRSEASREIAHVSKLALILVLPFLCRVADFLLHSKL